MRALWTGIHPIWVHYGPEPTLATITLHRGVLPPTARPGTTWVTRPTTRGYSPCQAKRLTALERPKGATLLIYCEGRLPAHPTTVQI